MNCIVVLVLEKSFGPFPPVSCKRRINYASTLFSDVNYFLASLKTYLETGLYAWIERNKSMGNELYDVFGHWSRLVFIKEKLKKRTS